MMDGAVGTLVSELRRSRKYRDTCDGVLDRTAEWALERHKSPKDALKAAKRKLHQVHGLFFDSVDFARIERGLDCMPGPDSEAMREFCGSVLDSHISTRERQAHLADFYREVFARTGYPASLLDLGCGLNPFALPWMNLPSGTSYRAIDANLRLASALNRFFEAAGFPALATAADILANVPKDPVEVALCLKLLPALEQQESGFGQRLVSELDARFIVVSFPTRSVGGRNVGMDRHYAHYMGNLLEPSRLHSEPFTIGNELVYILAK